MKREELLGWIGIVLAVPPIVYLVVSDGKWAAGAFVVLLLAALGREYIQGKRGLNRPTYTLLSVRKRYTITADPALAYYEGTFRVRANHRANSFTNSYLGGDGSIGNVKIDGADPSETITSGSRIEFVKKFSGELSPGDEFDLTVTYDLHNCFPGKTREGIAHVVEYEMKAVEVEVIFDSTKPCLSGELYKRFGGVKRQVPNGCHRRSDGGHLSFTAHKPQIGTDYLLEWTWR
jgi:hypothetical protein